MTDIIEILLQIKDKNDDILLGNNQSISISYKFKPKIIKFSMIDIKA